MDTPDKPIHLEGREQIGARLFSPTAARNRAPIANVLSENLKPNAQVLEIASGTGEHALYICQTRSDINWQPTDPDAESRASQNAWSIDLRDRIAPSLNIDTSLERWWENVSHYDAIFCANMIHIAPWEAALGLAKGASKCVRPEGQIFLYGPFLEGSDTAESNLAFDANLKTRDPAWGVRELRCVKHIFADAGFNACTRIEMPKENRLIIFSRS